jgi:hypothetical protein
MDPWIPQDLSQIPGSTKIYHVIPSPFPIGGSLCMTRIPSLRPPIQGVVVTMGPHGVGLGWVPSPVTIISRAGQYILYLVYYYCIYSTCYLLLLTKASVKIELARILYFWASYSLAI